LQDVRENSPRLLLENVTYPVGAEPKPTTVALHAVTLPTTKEKREHDNVTVVPGMVLTMSAIGDEITFSPYTSATWSSKYQVPAVASAPVGTEGLEERAHPVVKELQSVTKLVVVGAFSSHWHV
jgi:hypothetical protein